MTWCRWNHEESVKDVVKVDIFVQPDFCFGH